jgi:hypothetical protein
MKEITESYLTLHFISKKLQHRAKVTNRLPLYLVHIALFAEPDFDARETSEIECLLHYRHHQVNIGTAASDNRTVLILTLQHVVKQG